MRQVRGSRRQPIRPDAGGGGGGGRGGTAVPYWGKYVYHDNNRDINLSQRSMRAIVDWYFTAHPPIMHDLHESQPLLYTYSGAAPQNPESRSDPVRGAALVLELRAGADDEVGHAGRLHARVHGRLVAGLSRLCGVQPQRHDADVRDAGRKRCPPGQRHTWTRWAGGSRRRSRRAESKPLMRPDAAGPGAERRRPARPRDAVAPSHASGIEESRFRRAHSTTGPDATTRTTWRQASSRVSS